MTDKKLHALMAEIARFNENVMHDELSDRIVRKLWKNEEFIQVIEDSGVEIGDICIMLKADTVEDTLENFKLSTEIALNQGQFTQDQLEEITDLVQDLFPENLDDYDKDVIKLIDTLKGFDPDWSVSLEDSLFDMLHDALTSYGGYVVEVVD